MRLWRPASWTRPSGCTRWRWPTIRTITSCTATDRPPTPRPANTNKRSTMPKKRSPLNPTGPKDTLEKVKEFNLLFSSANVGFWFEFLWFLGAALAYLGRDGEALRAYEQGLKMDPDNQQLKEGLNEMRSKGSTSSAAKMMNPFQGPDVNILTFNLKRNFLKNWNGSGDEQIAESSENEGLV